MPLNAPQVDHISFFPSAPRELEAARALAAARHFTEAGLRLGRGLEACLYDAARMLNLQITDRVLANLEGLRETLRGDMIGILRHGSSESVRRLANAASGLSIAIATLSESAAARAGVASETPRNPEAIFRDLLAMSPGKSFRRKLESHQASIREVRILRNAAAHASLHGLPNELSEQEYLRMLGSLDGFMLSLCLLCIGQIATQVALSASPAP